jgi:uncharacterized protein YoxC
MNAATVLSGMWLQGDLNSTVGSTWLIVFVGLVALAMIIQAITVVGMAMGAAKTRGRVMEMAEELRAKMLPLIDQSRELLHDSAPKVKVIADNLVETSHTVRSRIAEFDATMHEANAKTRAQVARVDGMVTSVLNTTSDITQALQRAARIPAREFSGLMNGLKAGLDVLIGRKKTTVDAAREREPVGRF